MNDRSPTEDFIAARFDITVKRRIPMERPRIGSLAAEQVLEMNAIGAIDDEGWSRQVARLAFTRDLHQLPMPDQNRVFETKENES